MKVKSLISLALVTCASLSSCEKALDRSYKKAMDEAGEEKIKQAEADQAAQARDLIKESSLSRDLNVMAKKAGIDYPVLLEAALRKEKDAVVKLLWMAGNTDLDGASSEGYSYSMVQAARLIGDKDVSEAAKLLDDDSRKDLRMPFLFEYGLDSDPEAAVADIKKEFPLLWLIIGDS